MPFKLTGKCPSACWTKVPTRKVTGLASAQRHRIRRDSPVSDGEESLDKLCSLGIKYYPTREEGIETAKTNASRTQILELDIHHITGKRVHEK